MIVVCSSGQDTYFYQLFMDKDDRVLLPTTQQLLELSFMQSDVKLSEVQKHTHVQFHFSCHIFIHQGIKRYDAALWRSIFPPNSPVRALGAGVNWIFIPVKSF